MYEAHIDDIQPVLAERDDVCVLLQADCRDVLRRCPSNWAALVHTSPPYNIGRPYKGFSDAREMQQYQSFLGEVISDLARVIRP
jgi:DNA modification methylase